MSEIYRVHHLNCTSLNFLSAPLVNRRCSPLEGRVRCVIHCLLLETARSGLVLIDVGLVGTREAADPRRVSPMVRIEFGPRLIYEETALARVQSLGFDPRDVRHVVFTHLDVDHVGGLADFPWATAHAYAPEMRVARNDRSFGSRLRYDHSVLEGHERWELYEGGAAGGDGWFGLSGTRPVQGLGADLALVPLSGHSAGHCGVAVRAPDGWLLHAADTYLHRDEMLPPPEGPAATGLHQLLFAADGGARRESLARVRALRRDHGEEVTIFCSHDEAEFRRLSARSAERHPD